MINDALLPGMLHYVIISDHPLKRKYTKRGNVYVDSNIHDTGMDILREVYDEGFEYISLLRNVIVKGRSWEMSAYKALHDNDGVYSGTFIGLNGENPEFGDVPGKKIKQQVYKSISFGTS